MSLGNTSESDLLKLIFQNTNWANVGDAGGLRGSVSAGSFYISLHTGALTGASSQNTTEAAYTGYTRVAVARTAGAWTVSGSSPAQSQNVAAVTFPICTGGSETETYFAIGRDSAGAGQVLWYGALNSPLAVSNNITPSFSIGALVATLL